MFDSLKNLFKDKPASAAGSFDALKREGKDYVRNGNWDGAARCYREALAQRGDDVDTLVSLGFALSQLRQSEEAAAALHRAIERAPDNADAHYILGTIARDQGDRAQAITRFARALELESQLTDAYRDLSIAQFEAGQVEAAKATIRQGIAVDPGSAHFRMILGNVLGHEKDHAGAVAAYQSGLSIQPNSPELHNNMGNVLRDMGRIGAATTSYRTALSFQPDFADAHVNLANVMRDEGRVSEALTHYKAAIAAAGSVPAYVGATASLLALNRADDALVLVNDALQPLPDEPQLLAAQATALSALHRYDDAIATNRRVVELAPESVSAHLELGNLLVQTGDRQGALAAYQAALRLDPGNPVEHLIAAFSGNTSERAPDEYVAKLFDGYAEKFDSHLVKTLKYNMPDQIATTLRAANHPARGDWSVLDLGCGTGLAGVAIAVDAKHMVGVDLSEKMLARARALNLYARLERADLLSMMRSEVAASYDVVMAADVFVYIGKLDELAAEAHRLLRPGGLFAFSVEALAPETIGGPGGASSIDYRLNETGRYAHSRDYLERLASGNGFAVIGVTEAHGRVNEGKPVPGYIGLFRR